MKKNRETPRAPLFFWGGALIYGQNNLNRQILSFFSIARSTSFVSLSLSRMRALSLLLLNVPNVAGENVPVQSDRAHFFVDEIDKDFRGSSRLVYVWHPKNLPGRLLRSREKNGEEREDDREEDLQCIWSLLRHHHNLCYSLLTFDDGNERKEEEDSNTKGEVWKDRKEERRRRRCDRWFFSSSKNLKPSLFPP